MICTMCDLIPKGLVGKPVGVRVPHGPIGKSAPLSINDGAIAPVLFSDDIHCGLMKRRQKEVEL